MLTYWLAISFFPSCLLPASQITLFRLHPAACTPTMHPYRNSAFSCFPRNYWFPLCTTPFLPAI